MEDTEYPEILSYFEKDMCSTINTAIRKANSMYVSDEFSQLFFLKITLNSISYNTSIKELIINTSSFDFFKYLCGFKSIERVTLRFYSPQILSCPAFKNIVSLDIGQELNTDVIAKIISELSCLSHLGFRMKSISGCSGCFYILQIFQAPNLISLETEFSSEAIDNSETVLQYLVPILKQRPDFLSWRSNLNIDPIHYSMEEYPFLYSSYKKPNYGIPYYVQLKQYVGKEIRGLVIENCYDYYLLYKAILEGCTKIDRIIFAPNRSKCTANFLKNALESQMIKDEGDQSDEQIYLHFECSILSTIYSKNFESTHLEIRDMYSITTNPKFLFKVNKTTQLSVKSRKLVCRVNLLSFLSTSTNLIQLDLDLLLLSITGLKAATQLISRMESLQSLVMPEISKLDMREFKFIASCIFKLKSLTVIKSHSYEFYDVLIKSKFKFPPQLKFEVFFYGYNELLNSVQLFYVKIQEIKFPASIIKNEMLNKRSERKSIVPGQERMS